MGDTGGRLGWVEGRRRVILAGVATLVAGVLLLTGCSPDPLADQYRAGSGKNYVAGDGTITEIAAADRGKPIVFSAPLDTGDVISSKDLLGSVVVANFWYAGCAPCRAEAPDLEAVNDKFADDLVRFLGVNVRDELGTAQAFAKKYGVSYPTFLDMKSGTVQLAFSGEIAPNAVPTTIVLDREGRVAARILGRIPDASVLSALVTSALSEGADTTTGG
ncbi:hypothetical protein ASF62_11965 [Leifsonia sp. Leaf325]|nr:TlpA disulfide reductase family protein [Leifsonia sp. Leaf325]KQQ92562.1 hypothetical protein ASF62_11965 [Leifsonia sp. Leaf325]